MNTNIQKIKYNGLHQVDKFYYDYQNDNNCYTFAINQPLNPYTKEPYSSYEHCQPGRLGGKRKDNIQDYTRKNFHLLIDLAIKDLRDIGYEMVKSTYEEYVEDEDCWKIAFTYGDVDYHWYRQNIDGTWSHKKGQQSICDNDKDNKIIYDPRECNRDEYDVFYGFYLIRKIKNFSLIKFTKMLQMKNLKKKL